MAGSSLVMVKEDELLALKKALEVALRNEATMHDTLVAARARNNELLARARAAEGLLREAMARRMSCACCGVGTAVLRWACVDCEEVFSSDDQLSLADVRRTQETR